VQIVGFSALKKVVKLQRVLELVGWRATGEYNGHLVGPCPVHHSSGDRARCFQVRGETWYCCDCQEGGDVIRLWARMHSLDDLAAAEELCDRLRIPPPWKHNPRQRQPRRRG
jgi:hypothetical protein